MDWYLLEDLQVPVPAVEVLPSVETELQEKEDAQTANELEEQQVLDPETAGTVSQSLMLDQIPEFRASSASWPAAVLLGPTDPDNPKHLGSRKMLGMMGFDHSHCQIVGTAPTSADIPYMDLLEDLDSIRVTLPSDSP
jgi:hypothetical protein